MDWKQDKDKTWSEAECNGLILRVGKHAGRNLWWLSIRTAGGDLVKRGLYLASQTEARELAEDEASKIVLPTDPTFMLR
jgi:hypothetical protein